MGQYRKRWMAGATATLLAVATVVLAHDASAAPSDRRALSGSVPSWASASNRAGNAPDTDNVGFRVYLGWRDQAGAEALANRVSTPGSADYGKFVSAAQFRAQFAPSQ